MALIALVVSASASCQTKFGNEELRNQIGSATSQTVVGAKIRSAGKPESTLASDLLPELLTQVRELRSAKTIGKRSQWIIYCELEFELMGQGHFVIRLGTRPSLSGAPVAILRDKRLTSPRIAFYEGESLLAWLEENGLCSRSGPELSLGGNGR